MPNRGPQPYPTVWPFSPTGYRPRSSRSSIRLDLATDELLTQLSTLTGQGRGSALYQLVVAALDPGNTYPVAERVQEAPWSPSEFRTALAPSTLCCYWPRPLWALLNTLRVKDLPRTEAVRNLVASWYLHKHQKPIPVSTAYAAHLAIHDARVQAGLEQPRYGFHSLVSAQVQLRKERPGVKAVRDPWALTPVVV